MGPASGEVMAGWSKRSVIMRHGIHFKEGIMHFRVTSRKINEKALLLEKSSPSDADTHITSLLSHF
jgi:hypothetical protein